MLHFVCNEVSGCHGSISFIMCTQSRVSKHCKAVMRPMVVTEVFLLSRDRFDANNVQNTVLCRKLINE